MRKFLLQCILFMFLFVAVTDAQQRIAEPWREISESSVLRTGERWVVPQQYALMELNVQSFKEQLSKAPFEFSEQSKAFPLIIHLPLPDGGVSKFYVIESPIMEQGLAEQFPEIKTYAAKGIDDPYATARLDWTMWGFHGMILSPNGTVFIDPYCRGNISQYVVYHKSGYVNEEKRKWMCNTVTELRDPSEEELKIMAGICVGSILRRYRLAVSCTVEYTNFYGGTVAGAMGGITTSVNRVSGVYETEVSIRLMLIANNSNIVYAGTDPYTGNNNAGVLINESQTNINAVIGSANYDIGHTFSTGAGGLAALGVVCNNSNKARGVTGSPSPVGDPYDIDYVAHEIGHQFGGNHTFNGLAGSCCCGNRNGSTAYEPGSGTTIQAYAGICSSDNIQPNSDPFFHNISYVEIVNFSNTGGGSACAFQISTGNNAPNPNAGINYSIPVSTPFTLTGTATDPDNDPMTYCWEQMDLGTGGAWNVSTGTAPLFKSRVPKTVPSRTFPDMAVILAGYPVNPPATMGGLKGETLPSTARTMRFRMTVRDNKLNGGGVCWDSMTVAVVNNGGAFSVTSPNTSGINWIGGSSQTITWNVSGTTNSPISCPLVTILMSTDGGLTYPAVLASNVPNNGSATITVPNISTNNTVRIMVLCANNIFFDISNFNHTITFNSALPVSLIEFSAAGMTDHILLSWTTLSEKNNKGFELQRSLSADEPFESIHWVDGKINSSIPVHYSFKDFSAETGQTYYYRLKQTDTDGNFNYSSVAAARINPANNLSIVMGNIIFQNDVSVILSGLTEIKTVFTLINLAGQIVFSEEFVSETHSGEFHLDFSEVSGGLYLMKIRNGESEIGQKVIKM